MKGRASIASGGLRATAHAIPTATAKAAALLAVSGLAGDALRPIDGSADRTRETGLFHWLQVTPTEPQQLLWLNPQYGIDYDIRTSSGLDWNII
jgi:methylmalonyl-CoA mutase cobalamin-binding subunit